MTIVVLIAFLFCRPGHVGAAVIFDPAGGDFLPASAGSQVV